MFAVQVSKERFKFSCAHFVAYKGFRERVHGHNYQVGVTLIGSESGQPGSATEDYFGCQLGHDGYLLDFGIVKEHATRICKSWNEHIIIPTESDVLEYDSEKVSGHLAVTCVDDGAEFLFPLDDCLCLPIKHSTAEELGMHFAFLLVESISATFLRERNVEKIKISVGETPNQVAWFQMRLSEFENFKEKKLQVQPRPCFMKNNSG